MCAMLGGGGIAEHEASAVTGGGGTAEQEGSAVTGGGGIAEQDGSAVLGGGGMTDPDNDVRGGGGIIGPERARLSAFARTTCPASVTASPSSRPASDQAPDSMLSILRLIRPSVNPPHPTTRPPRQLGP
jgi:hypothetical protein